MRNPVNLFRIIMLFTKVPNNWYWPIIDSLRYPMRSKTISYHVLSTYICFFMWASQIKKITTTTISSTTITAVIIPAMVPPSTPAPPLSLSPGAAPFAERKKCRYCIGRCTQSGEQGFRAVHNVYTCVCVCMWRGGMVLRFPMCLCMSSFFLYLF